MKLNRRWLVFLLPIVAVLVPLSAASTGGAASGPSGSLTVWVDAVRLPVAKLYAKTHPNVHLNIVTYDGDGNGSTTMQTKIQLWNRTGNGWPDVIFTEQANDPVWMGSPPFNFAMDLKSVFPAKLLANWPAPSLAQCTVNGHLVCLQDNLAQEVLYVNKKLMTQFGYKVPTTWQQWAALGKKVATAASRVTSSGTSATPTVPGSTSGPTSARSHRSSRRTPSGSTPTTCTARGWRTCSIR